LRKHAATSKATPASSASSELPPGPEAAGSAQKKTREPVIYSITKYGDPVLEAMPKTIEKFDDQLAEFCDDMFASMYAASGVGLAAPQVGVGKRLAVIDVTVGKNPEARIVLANPEIIRAEGEQREEEGCLSLPGFRGNVSRPQYVTVRAQNVTGETFEMNGEGLLARAFCHEIDHLNGILFIQHLSLLKRDLIRRRIRKLRKAGEW
jgi:peptide deformylase